MCSVPPRFCPGRRRAPGPGRLLLACSLLLLWGCKDEKKGSYYEEAETTTTPTPAMNPPEGPTALPDGHPPIDADHTLPPAGGMDSMEGQTLPPDAIGQGSLPTWTLPEGWSAGPDRPMRRATLLAGADALEVAVTAFPGSVGSLSANVNRWRRQLGLPPVSEAEMVPMVTERSVHGKSFLIVDLAGATGAGGEDAQRILAAIAMHAGDSWFFKMTGPTDAVEALRPEFLALIDSVRFPAGGEMPR